MSFGFVGAGNMATSLIGGLIQSDANPNSIRVADINVSACAELNSRFGVLPSDIDEFSDCQAVVIAVKPHIVKEVCGELSQVAFSTQPVFISVAAGVREASMRQWLPEHSAIVRCMPNTPALLGLGSTGLVANSHCSDHQKALAQQLLEAAGITVWVEREEQLDAVTAVSGSGPAYFFYLIEHMIEAGVKLGLDHTTASTLAIETAFGAASMARARNEEPAVLRENVTSKGGTTAAALNTFDAANTAQTIEQAMTAAYERAITMGDEFGV